MVIILKSINIAFVTDENYFKYMTITIESVLKYAQNNIEINFYIIDSGVNKDSITFLNQLYYNHENVKFEFISIDTSLISKYNIKTHVSIAAYAKVFISELLEIDKVIYLDCDLILNNDISKLWNEFDDDKYIKAVWNPYYNYDNEYLGLEKNERTFNSGVMLLNLKMMRDMQKVEDLVEFLNEYHNKTKLHDQAAFNAVFKNEWEELDYRWNYQVLMIQSHYKDLGLSKNEYKNLYNNPLIIHFNTGSKPWQCRNNHPYKNIFKQYYKEIYGEMKYSDTGILTIYKGLKERVKYIYYFLINI